MDLANRRWGVAALFALGAAVLLTLAAFLPLFITESGIAPADPVEHITVTSWGSERTVGDLPPHPGDPAYTTGYQQLFGAAMALAAGLLATITARTGLRGGKGSLVLLVAAGAFNLGVVSIIGATLAAYVRLYPSYNGPDGRTVSSLGVGTWLMFAGALLSLVAAIVVLRRKQAPVAQNLPPANDLSVRSPE